MNILVFLKTVSQQQFADTLSDQTARLETGNLIPNPADVYALELALRIKDQTPETVVTVLSMGPQSCEQELRTILAMGADHAVLLSDRRLAGSDTLVTAEALAAAMANLPRQDLLLCGKKSLDSETGHIGPQVATIVGYPFCTNVVDFSLDGDVLCFVRAQNNGMVQYTGHLPALLSVCNGDKTVRVPTILSLRRSKKAEIRRMTLDDLKLDPANVGVSGSCTKTKSVKMIDFHRGNKQRTESLADGEELLDMLLRQHGEEG